MFIYYKSKKEHALEDSLFWFAKNTICIDAKKNLSNFHSKIVINIKNTNQLFLVAIRAFLDKFRHISDYFYSKTGLGDMIW